MKNNKGEWSEFYAFLKILESGMVFAADKDLKAIAGKFFIFHKIFREEVRGTTKIYEILPAKQLVLIKNEEDAILKKFDCSHLGEKTKRIFEKIKSTSKSSFCVIEAQKLMKQLLCEKVKASSDKKADLMAIIDDRISDELPVLGFSIKSMVGGASTLLNPGKTTNFIYRITGFHGNISGVNTIHSKAKIRDRIKTIYDNGGSFEFVNVSNEHFNMNLRMLDSALPEFIARMLLNFFSSDRRTVKDLTEGLTEHKHNNQKINSPAGFYEYKIKAFLDAIALGMVPDTAWDGFSKAHGGYLVVKENGDVVCYHLYNRDEFKNYLYENTKFDASSTGRYDYGRLYKKDSHLFFNLNLQIRFIR